MRIVRVMALMLCALMTIHAVAQEAPAGDQPRRGGTGRGNWDPAQMQERMMTHQKEQLGINDEEWEIVKPLLATVFEKQQAVRELQSRGFGRRPGGDRAQAAEVEAVTKALEAKDTEAITKALTELRAARVVREADLKEAREALRDVLTVDQEAKLVLSGMLN